MQNQLFNSMLNALQQRENILLTGMSATAGSYVISELARQTGTTTLCMVPDEEKAYDLLRDLKAFIDEQRLFLFLGRELIFLKENFSRVEEQRILTLRECIAHPRKQKIIIATPGAFMFPIMSPQKMDQLTIQLKVNEEQSLRGLLEKLVAAGYKRSDTVSRSGEFALRGGILDVFPVGDREPCRIDFFGDYIDSMRRFNLDSQRSIKTETSLIIACADETLGDELGVSLLDYLPGDAWIFFDEPRDFYRNYDRNSKRYQAAIKEAHREEQSVRELPLVPRETFMQSVQEKVTAWHSFFPGNIPQVRVSLMEHVSVQDMEPFFGQLEPLFLRLREWIGKGYQVQLAVSSKTAREQLQQELIEQHISGPEIVNYRLDKGFISPTLELALVTEKDIWGAARGKTSQRKKASGQERLLLEDLKLGDYVVHDSYGIGIFRGVTQVETDGVIREYILLQYAGTDKLYLPLEKTDHLFKYTAAEEREPRLSKLGGNEWERTKRKVSQSIQDMAEDLLKLYAARQAREGYAFSPDAPWQNEFESRFPYQETPDQLKAINDVKADMESIQPMERLICGDVGYGKTEVAMRAAFKAIMDGKQVALLVPTTVLAEQHYMTFQQRFAEYPTTIEVLSRFRSTAQQKRIITDLKKGVIDIVIGTHRLISKDVEFKDLGLLIIDEEHRFGVSQKEKIKAMKELVDVISLSATPIPRSLHMSLAGLRDMTVIETPPPERYPITTYVLEYNDDIIRDAIQTEIDRGGQVFFVHNRIEDIYQVRQRIQALLPDIRIAVGHGKMKEEELSRVMLDLIEGKFEVFLCTTIIESGLDMPNVNTIIIDEADRMGLAQLYQLRGRVGRSNRLAYAYLTYKRDRVISETAQKRLNAIREFSDLGSGMKIALRDLEIRGAGNILGPEQHGFIYAVGFDLYCRLLEQETARLKGEISPTEQFNPQLDIDVDYYIPDTYIPDSGTKMRIYRRLLLATEIKEIEEISREMLDRFGKFPVPVENFLHIASLRIMARHKEIKSLRRKGNRIELQMAGPLPPNLLPAAQGLKIRKINASTVQIQQQGTSLTDLATLLSLI